MRTLLLILLLSPLAAAAQNLVPHWEIVASAPTARARFDDIKFVTPTQGWLASTDGEIWKTSDGGASWTLQADMSQMRFRSLVFPTEQTGFAGLVFTAAAVLMETRDGGATWSDASWRISGPRPAGICGMWAVDEFNLYGVGAFHGSPILIRSYNGGSSWLATDMGGQAGSLVDVRFVNDRVGFMTGGTGSSLDGNAVVLRTEDGGDTWVEVHETQRAPGLTGEWGWKIHFPTEDVGYVAVEYSAGQGRRPAKVLKTTDGGLTWSEIYIEGSTESAGLQGIGFISETVGWASGRGTTSVTTDGGDTWTQLRDWSETFPAGELDGAVNRFFQVNDTLAYAIGEHVYRLTSSKTGTAVERDSDVPRSFEIGPIYPNPADGPVTIPLRLERPATVRLWVIDLLGRVVRDYPASVVPAGTQPLTWDGLDAAGRRPAPGPYLVLLDVGESKEMKQVVVVR